MWGFRVALDVWAAAACEAASLAGDFVGCIFFFALARVAEHCPTILPT